ncbi:hypothetical protein PanWU01x14_124350 [Parasponia andersonii]|uniref:Uncharacterized protein n=1 Tax=Parasponia andersonii TaxID=3476 RepID=A0A2P5CTU1_PARAD|nr:hypothetical protein PanWU01x14_124350 [Parasponia andersonii]
MLVVKTLSWLRRKALGHYTTCGRVDVIVKLGPVHARFWCRLAAQGHHHGTPSFFLSSLTNLSFSLFWWLVLPRNCSHGSKRSQ